MVDVLVDRNRTERKEKTIYLGFCDEMGIREANKERDKHITTVNNAPLVVQSQVLFKDLAEAYKATYLPGLKPSSRHGYEHRLDKYIVPFLGSLRLHEIDAMRVQKWVYQLEDAGLARATRQNVLAILRSVFEAASEWGYFMGRNPAKHIKLGDGQEVYERTALDPAQALRLLQALQDQEPLRTVVEVALFTGLRASEVLGLTWGAINIEHSTIEVKQGLSQQGEMATPKSARARRRVDLGPLSKRLIRPAEAKPTDLVWPDTTYFALQHQLRRLAKKIGLDFKGLGFHTLRRTYATLRESMRSQKPDAALVAAMGHSTSSMTAHYIRSGDAGVVEELRNLVFFSGISRDDDKVN